MEMDAHKIVLLKMDGHVPRLVITLAIVIKVVHQN